MKSLHLHILRKIYIFSKNVLPLLAIGIMMAILPKFTNSVQSTKLLSIPQNRPLPSSEVGEVTKVHDGDTITVKRGFEQLEIRLACIDSPELAQPLGKESKANLQRLISASDGQVLLVVLDTIDSRKAAEVFTSFNGQEKFLQEEQLKAGLAYVYEPSIDNCLNAESMRRAQAIAISNRAGIWAGNNIKPWDYRKAKR